MRRKNPARKSAKKSGGPKIKIREKSVLPKAGTKRCFGLFFRSFSRFSGVPATPDPNLPAICIAMHIGGVSCYNLVVYT